jgi:hypothetical protein
LKEKAGVWPLSPSGVTVLQGGSAPVSRPERPKVSLTLLGGGGDASGLGLPALGHQWLHPRQGRQANPSLGRYLRPPQRTKEAVMAAEGWPPAHDALVSPNLGVSIVLPPPPPPPQWQEPGMGVATAVVTVTKKRKMTFPKSSYMQSGGFGFLHSSFSLSDLPILYFLTACARGPGCPLGAPQGA